MWMLRMADCGPPSVPGGRRKHYGALRPQRVTFAVTADAQTGVNRAENYGRPKPRRLKVTRSQFRSGG